MELITRKEAKEKGLTHYYTGKPCKHGHISKRFTSAGKCVTCGRIELAENKDKRKEYYKKNNEAIRKKVNEYRLSNAEVISKRKNDYYQKNRDEILKRRKEFRDNNSELISRQKKDYYRRNWSKIRKAKKEFYRANRSDVLLSQKEFYKRNKRDIKKRVKAYREKNRENIRSYLSDYNKRKYRDDPLFKLRMICRGHLRRVLIYTGENRNLPTFQMLGYDTQQLRERIESTWIEGMSWDNHGEWHIDHIKSIKSFIDEGVHDPKIINALENLQALWAFDNLSKGSS